MKTILIVCSVIISTNIYSQSILSDKKDLAANTRTITTGTNPLYKSFSKTVQVQSQVNIQNDDITSYDLNFSAPDATTEDNANSSSSNSCLLKDENGAVFNGTLNRFSEFSGQSYTCRFSKDDFFKIVALKITDIKISLAAGKEEVFSIDKKLQDIISKQAKAILMRFKNPG